MQRFAPTLFLLLILFCSPLTQAQESAEDDPAELALLSPQLVQPDTLHLALAAPAQATHPPALSAEADVRTPRERLRHRQLVLSSMWAFTTLNYAYCDILSLMDAHNLRGYEAGEIDGIEVTEGFLTAATVLMEVPMSMVFLSVVLEPRAARIANIAAGTFMTLVQTATLFIGHTSAPYLASSIVEISSTAFITFYAAFGLRESAVQPMVSVTDDSAIFTVRFAR